MEVLSQIGNRLSAIERNLGWITEVLLQAPGPARDSGAAGNVFSRAAQLGLPAQVPTPNFKLRAEINFDSEARPAKPPAEGGRAGSGGGPERPGEGANIIQKSFGSFQECADSAQEDRRRRPGEKGDSPGSPERLQRAESPEAPLSDLILSDKHLERPAEPRRAPAPRSGKERLGPKGAPKEKAPEENGEGARPGKAQQPSRSRNGHPPRAQRYKPRGRRPRKRRGRREDQYYQF